VTAIERRRAERRVPAPGEPLCRLRIRTGRELTVINIANSGALVEGPPLMPGACIHLHISTAAGRALVVSRVLRCEVSQVTANTIAYRSGLMFEEPVDTASGYEIPAPELRAVESQGRRYPKAGGETASLALRDASLVI
jgi:hypothetical protein